MTKVFASWERRNLGCDAWEVELTAADAANLDATLCALRDPCFAGCYVVVKIPVGFIRLLHALEDDGFRFVESQLRLRDVLEPDAMLKSICDLDQKFNVVQVRKDRVAWERVAEMITPGMFDTDRIALDPLYGPEVSCRRYRNWFMDLFDDPNSILSLYVADGKEVAFNIQICDLDKDVNRGVLGGVFEPFKGSGCGVFFVLDNDNRKKYGKRTTSVSSNNLSVLKLHQRCGRIVVGETYVLRKQYAPLNKAEGKGTGT